MSYYRSDQPPSPIDLLLNELEAAEAEDLSPYDHPPPPPPTLDHFLYEEDVLREARSGNKRLLAYLSRPQTIAMLIDKSFDVPDMIAPIDEPNGSASDNTDNSDTWDNSDTSDTLDTSDPSDPSVTTAEPQDTPDTTPEPQDTQQQHQRTAKLEDLEDDQEGSDDDPECLSDDDHEHANDDDHEHANDDDHEHANDDDHEDANDDDHEDDNEQHDRITKDEDEENDHQENEQENDSQAARPRYKSKYDEIGNYTDVRKEREWRMKCAYVASELLTSDNTTLSDAMVEEDIAMKRMFALLERRDPGELDGIVAIQFSKIVVNLLKMNILGVLEFMGSPDNKFIDYVLKHIGSFPIAELLVRILDSAQLDPSCRTGGDRRASKGALDLLFKRDILQNLVACFVQASSAEIRSAAEADVENDSSHLDSETGNGDSESLNKQDDRPGGEGCLQRRLREETMANVAVSILGLTERLLQFPEFGIRIPDKLNPYTSPAIIARLLDAGLYVYNSGNALKKVGPGAKDDDGNAERVEAFNIGGSSALVYGLGLCADILTTEVNVMHDDEVDDGPLDTDDLPPAGGPSLGGPTFSGKGIGPSIHAGSDDDDDDDASEPAEDSPPFENENENGDVPPEIPVLPELANKKPGDPIAETDLLEAELAIRFARLSDMLGSIDNFEEEASAKPLGSLRLKLAEFFVACMRKGSQETVDQIANLRVPEKLLKLFQVYSWSSMLHGVITNAIINSFLDPEVYGPARRAWRDAGVIKWLLETWAKNANEEDQNIHGRAGYMGHLIRIGTALKGYFDEYRGDPKSDISDSPELEEFAVFAEAALEPAQTLETTPLCNGRADSDDGEEATDVLEMGGIQVVEGITVESSSKDVSQFGYSALKTDNDVDDDDEEIKPVEVDDLGHFGADEDDDSQAQSIDHDIPAEMRERLSRESKGDDSKKATDEKNKKSSKGLDHKSGEATSKPPTQNAMDNDDDYKGIINTVDSSSDDEGSYVAFVDDQRENEIVEKVTEKLDNVKLEDDTTDSSIAGAVTEIEEPGPIGGTSAMLPTLASNVVSISDDESDSSDDEYEVWQDPSITSSSSSSAQGAQESKSSGTKAEVESSSNVG